LKIVVSWNRSMDWLLEGKSWFAWSSPCHGTEWSKQNCWVHLEPSDEIKVCKVRAFWATGSSKKVESKEKACIESNYWHKRAFSWNLITFSFSPFGFNYTPLLCFFLFQFSHQVTTKKNTFSLTSSFITETLCPYKVFILLFNSNFFFHF